MRINLNFKTLVLAALLGLKTVSAQNISCGDGAVINLQKSNITDYEKVVRDMNLNLKSYIDNNLNNANSLKVTAAGGYVIPVVFHIVHPVGQPYGTGANISYNQILSQINALNAAFSKSYPTYNGQTHPSYAQNTTIQFCLAKTPMPATANFYVGTGTEFGVMRYADNTLTNHSISNPSATALKALTHPTPAYFPEDNYLNIWVVTSIGGGPGTVMGYAPKPLMGSYPLDGIVMRSDIIGDNTTGNTFPLSYGLTQGKILAHEAGHYLNLMHIFEGGCAGANAAIASSDQCDLNGDMICDIEPCTTQNISCSSPIPNTCSASYTTGTTNMDMIESYMSYADDDCMNTFTSNQTQRMIATLNTTRFGLWQTTNLINTGIVGVGSCINPFLMTTININPGSVCKNVPVQFSNPLTGNTASSWTWTMPGASPASANTSSVSVTYTATGSYWVRLSVSDGTVTAKDSLLLAVSNCTLDPTKLDEANWHFGDKVAVNFNSGAPVGTSPSSINTFEPAASISDSLGNLLFYTDGNKVWNKNHVQMMNLGGLLTGGTYNNLSASQGALIIPVPGDNKKYYVLTGGQQPAVITDSIRRNTYSIIDMNLSSGLGNISLINQPLPGPYFLTTEGQTAVPHCNGRDYWYIVHGAKTTGYTDKIAAYLITPGGFSAPVISNGGYPVPSASATSTDGYISFIEASPDGKTIAITDNATSVFVSMKIYSFNNTTGKLGIYSSVPLPSAIPALCQQFSPNSQYLYISDGNAVTQINLTTPTSPTSTVLFNNNMNRLYFQLGPDNKIYGSTPTSTQNRLSVINFPDLQGAAASFSFNTIVLLPAHIVKIGLPNMIDAKKPPALPVSFSKSQINCNTTQFIVDSCWQAYTANWNFGDGGNASGLLVSHTYTSTGTFTVSMVLSIGSYSFTAVNQVVNIIPATTAISGPTVICKGSTFLNSYGVSPISGATYSWTTSNASIIGLNSIPSINVGALTSGLATLSIQIMNGGCTIVGTKTITIDSVPIVNFVSIPSAVCSGNNINMSGNPAGGIFSGPGVSGSVFNPTTAGIGTHQLYYVYTNTNGCSNTAAATVSVTAPCTGINEIVSVEDAFTIFPNPSNGEFKITATKEMAVTITNELGQLVYTKQIKAANNYSVEVFGLSSGVYFIDNGAVRKKIVVVK
jgi:hypothetical protein